MSDPKINELYIKIEAIIKNYLYNASTLKKHDYFNSKNEESSRTMFLGSSGFGFSILSSRNPNEYIVEEEAFLEGCTRIFLINPIMKLLLDSYHIQNDWQFGDTFGNYMITNRVYELGNYIEFIAVLNGKHVGIRYTTNSYSLTEKSVMDRDFQYLYRSMEVPGFEILKKIDELFVLDWYGLSDNELLNLNRKIGNLKNLSTIMTVEQFFIRFFPNIKYAEVADKLCDALEKARKIVALSAVPQLLPNNMLNFKNSILNGFTEEKVDSFLYEFEDGHTEQISCDDDIAVIKKMFFNNGQREALIGKAAFAKSFITSEYLFSIINSGLSIDYTSVVVGYLKSIEQLLYLLYKSAFEGKSGMEYWDKLEKNRPFDLSLPDKYRVDPYNMDRGWKQEKYYHPKKTGNNAPDIGELTRFLRYYTKMWALSESGKDFVFKCLEDFRKYNRNSHLHKDNINSYQYSNVKRIRNNAHVCLYYLLGGFILLDSSVSVSEQLGIVDYRFERFYQTISQRRIRYFNAKFSDGTACVIFYLADDLNVDFNSDGILPKAELRFLKTEIKAAEAFFSNLQKLQQNENFVKTHTISITRENMPLEIIPFFPRKNKLHK